MRFKYTALKLPSTSPRPYLDIVLRHGSATALLIGLVDSGADFPIFPEETARQLKLNLSHAPRWTFSGTTGVRQHARIATVNMTILTQDDMPKPAFDFRPQCAFCPDFEFAGGGVLGESGFFSFFRTQFFEPMHFFEIDPWDEADVKVR